jgi:hypothetical protein
MKFTKDKDYDFMSYTKPFKIEYTTKYYDRKFQSIVRWQIDNFREFSAYDSPKAEYKGKLVKCNYKLELCAEHNINGKKTFFLNDDDFWNFHTKKELKEFLNNFNDCMKKGISNNYYNFKEYKIIK